MSRDVSLLHPRLQVVVRQLQTEFPSLLITQTMRTQAEQDELYAKGRTKPGSIVTNVKYPYSQHNWGVAFDFANNDASNLYPADFMRKVAQRAKELGLVWGGDWLSFVDTPHLYLPDWGSSPNALVNQYGTPSNFIATWGISLAPTPIKNESEEHEMKCFYSMDGKGPVIYFDGFEFRPIKNKDEMNILNKIYKDCTGKDIPCYSWLSKAPWNVRLKDITTRKPLYKKEV